MCGGGGWDPGEATDDTQMAVLVAESLLERSGLDLRDIFVRFQRWAASEPKDIGLQTEDVLTNGLPWDRAAARHFEVNQRAAGNGSLMRASTPAVYFARAGHQATMNAARRIAALSLFTFGAIFLVLYLHFRSIEDVLEQIVQTQYQPLPMLVLLRGMSNAVTRLWAGAKSTYKPLCVIMQFAPALFPEGDFDRLSELDQQRRAANCEPLH